MLNQEFLNTLQCPYSGSVFTLKDILQGDSEDILFGIAVSEAGCFPIVSGILRLQYDELREPIIEALTKGDMDGAQIIALDFPFQNKFSAAIFYLSRALYKTGHSRIGRFLMIAKLSLYRKLIKEDISFSKLMDRLGSRYLAEWQKYRYSMGTFVPTIAMLHFIKNQDYILDLGCGFGHASYLISLYADECRIVCADSSFSSLYIGQKYFAPKSNFICLDGNCLLPFKDGFFSNVFCSDALHFIDSKALLIQEFKRVITENGKIAIGHAHNSSSPIKSGRALNAEAYAALFKGLHTKVIPKQALINEFIENGTMDLDKVWANEELEESVEGLSIIASKDKKVIRKYEGLWNGFIDRVINVEINPIYKITKQGNCMLLTKSTSKDYQKLVDARIKNYCVESALLDTIDLGKQTLEDFRKINPLEFSELIKKFVLIACPRSYK